MKKILVIQLITWLTFIISIIVFAIEGVKTIHLFSSSDPLSFFGIIAGGLAMLSIIIFLVYYVIRICKETNKMTRIILIFIPIIGAIFSSIYVNGVMDMEEFPILVIISIFFELIMIGLYNLFVLFYCPNKIRPYFSIVLYNIIVIIHSCYGSGLGYIHHYYLGYIIVFLPIIIIEYLIKDKFFTKIAIK